LKREIFIPHKLEDKWAIRDIRTDDLMRRWRKGGRGLIWRGTFEEAESLCDLLNRGEQDAPREEMSKTQKIHYMNRNKRNPTQSTVTKPSFVRCTGCDKMVKTGHNCAKGEPA
jgi:hypothetical protein